MKKVVLALACVFFVGMSGSAEAEDLKFGIVDLQRALNESAAGEAAREQFVTEMEKLQAKLRAEKKSLDVMREEFDKKAMLLREKERLRKERELEDKGLEFKRKYEDYQKQLKRTDNEYTGAILRDLESVIREVGEREGYSMILESQSSGILYGDPAMDLTDSVVRAYNERSKKRD